MDEWINLCDRLPELYDAAWNDYLYSVDVLVYTSSHEYLFGHFEVTKDKKIYFVPDRANQGWEVTHYGETYWRDIPAPPKIRD